MVKHPRPRFDPSLSQVEEVALGAPSGILVLEPPCRLVWANDAFFEITGRPRGFVGSDLREAVGLKGSPVLRAFEQALGSGVVSTLREVPLTARHGERFVDVDVWPLVGPATEGPSRAIALVTDQTDRVLARERARLFYESFMTSSDAIEITDAQGVIVDVNPAFERIYGYAREECLGRKPSLVRSRKTPSSVYEKMWASLSDPSIGHWSGEIVNRDRSGRERPVFLTITAVRDEKGTAAHYLGVAVDLAEQRAWEQGAAHAERLASLGRMAAGVAHEINTPLANVLLVAESIRRRSQDPWLNSRIGAIVSQVEVAAKIVRGLLDFSRRSETNVHELDMSVVTRDAVEFLRGKQSADVEIQEVYPDGPVLVEGDRNQLIQVLTNILNNAYEAIEGSGRIRIEVRTEEGSAEVVISDSGPGIPEEALPHIFEPFFTTKEEGKGTGLGLAICHGIVQSHRGAISAHNMPTGGASFSVRLPLRPQPEATSVPAQRGAELAKPSSRAAEGAREGRVKSD